MNIGEYLKKNYPGVKSVKQVVVGGKVKGYFATSSNSNQIYIPVSALNSKSVSMFSYIPGAGGSGPDAATLRERINRNPPDYIVTISGGAGDRSNCIGTGYSMAKGLDMNVKQMVTVCYSLSGYIGIDHTADFLKNHPEIASTVISCEPYPYNNHNVYQGNSTRINALKNSGSKLIFITPQSFHINMKDELQSLNNKGIDAYWLQTHYTTSDNHWATNWDVLNSGMIEFILGEKADFNKNPNPHYKTGYKLIGVDEKTGRLIYAKYDDLVQNGIGVIEIPDISKLMSSDTSKAKTKVSPAQKKYASLKDLTDKTITSKDGKPISSEFEYVEDTMNALKQQIKASSFLGSLHNIKCKDSNGIPGCIMEYVNRYFDVVGCLLNDLAMESDAYISYGQAVVDMDFDIKSGTETLGKIYEEDNSSKYIALGGLEAFVEPDDDDDDDDDKKKTTDTDTDTPDTTTLPTDDYYYPGTGSNPSSSPSSPQTVVPQQQVATDDETTEENEKDEYEDEIDQDVEEVELNEKEITANSIKEETNPIVTVTPAEENVTPTETQPAAEQPVEQGQQGGNNYNTYTDYQPYNEAAQVPVEETPTIEPTIENADDMDTDMITETNSIEDIMPQTTPTISKIPVSSEPIPSKKKGGSSIIPIIGGLAVATAAGIGAKAYIDKKTNSNNGEENTDEDNFEETDFQEELDYDANETKEEPEGAYIARNLEDIESLQ